MNLNKYRVYFYDRGQPLMRSLLVRAPSPEAAQWLVRRAKRGRRTFEANPYNTARMFVDQIDIDLPVWRLHVSLVLMGFCAVLQRVWEKVWLRRPR